MLQIFKRIKFINRENSDKLPIGISELQHNFTYACAEFGELAQEMPGIKSNAITLDEIKAKRKRIISEACDTVNALYAVLHSVDASEEEVLASMNAGCDKWASQIGCKW